MNAELSQKQIGQRIAILRKLKGLSQEDLARNINISRPSLAQIELGNRGVDVLELQKLSIALRFSLDIFVNKFKNVLLYILERCAGKPNVGETVLYKLLYFSDFNFYEIDEEHLTGATYRKER